MTLHSPGVGGDSATTVATAVWSMLAGTDTDWGRLAAGAGRGHHGLGRDAGDAGGRDQAGSGGGEVGGEQQGVGASTGGGRVVRRPSRLTPLTSNVDKLKLRGLPGPAIAFLL